MKFLFDAVAGIWSNAGVLWAEGFVFSEVNAYDSQRDC
jgi:hypothetical protein